MLKTLEIDSALSVKRTEELDSMIVSIEQVLDSLDGLDSITEYDRSHKNELKKMKEQMEVMRTINHDLSKRDLTIYRILFNAEKK